jgi:hypothetical protein
MKLRFLRMAVLSTVVLRSALVTLAGDQPARMYRYPKNATEDRTAVTRAVQQGKGGRTRNEKVLRGNAYRSNTTPQRPQATDRSAGMSPNLTDTAFRK